MADTNMEGQRKKDPFEAEPWLIAEVFARIDNQPDAFILKWVNEQYHSTYKDEFQQPHKYNKHMSWLKSIKTKKRKLDDAQGIINETINWIDYKKIDSLNISRANLSRCRAVIGALKGKMLSSIPVQHTYADFIDEERNTIPERQDEWMLMTGKPFDVKEDYRWLKWADYILTYAGNDITDDLDIWIIAKVFANRDREHYYSIADTKTNNTPKSKYFIDKEDLDGKRLDWNDVLGGIPLISKAEEPEPKVYMQDLDDWLDYRPWVSKEKEDIYIKALADSQAAKLNFKLFPFSLPLTGVAQMHNTSEWSEPIMGFYGFATFLWNIHPNTPWALPSKQLEEYCQEEQTLNNLHLVFKFGNVQFGWRFDPPKKGKSNIQD